MCVKARESMSMYLISHSLISPCCISHLLLIMISHFSIGSGGLKEMVERFSPDQAAFAYVR